MNRGVTEAAEELVNFAWSAVVTDCTESADYLNQLVDNLRAALAAEPGAAEGDWVADRQMLAEAAEDMSLSDGAVRCLCLARQGKITPEIRKWAEGQLEAAAPHQSGENGK